MTSFDSHVKCQRIDSSYADKHIKHMARQRCVGVSDGSPV